MDELTPDELTPEERRACEERRVAESRTKGPTRREELRSLNPSPATDPEWATPLSRGLPEWAEWASLAHSNKEQMGKWELAQHERFRASPLIAASVPNDEPYPVRKAGRLNPTSPRGEGHEREPDLPESDHEDLQDKITALIYTLSAESLGPSELTRIARFAMAGADIPREEKQLISEYLTSTSITMDERRDTVAHLLITYVSNLKIDYGVPPTFGLTQSEKGQVRFAVFHEICAVIERGNERVRQEGGRPRVTTAVEETPHSWLQEWVTERWDGRARQDGGLPSIITAVERTAHRWLREWVIEHNLHTPEYNRLDEPYTKDEIDKDYERLRQMRYRRDGPSRRVQKYVSYFARRYSYRGIVAHLLRP